MEYIKNQAPEVCAYLKVKARKTIKRWFAMRVTYRREAEIKRILDLHVEAIISNYPDRVLKVTRGYVK